jgi:glycosyltransferase involved in cell wall biosynthesis
VKILFCAYDRPGHIATGPNAWIQRLILDLKNTYRLDIITLFFYTGEITECPTISYFESNKLDIKTCSISKHQYIEDQVRHLLKIVRNHHINVVVANLTVAGYYSAKFLNKYNIPCIPVFHSNDDFTKGVFRKFIHNQSNALFNTTVSVSEYINKLSQSKNGHIIPCGTPSSTSTATPPTDILKVVYAGRLVIEAKQILKLTDSFIAASKQNKNLYFNIIGDGPYYKEVNSILLEHNRKQVTLLPALPPSKIIDEIAKHHILTLLSDYEGMPISIMEAMSVGVVPVCYVGEGGISELIEDGLNGFIVKNRGEDYLNKLNLLLNDSNLWQQMSKNAIETIRSKYSTEITHKKWAELLLSFKDSEIDELILPNKIELDGEPLLYGDNRKPTLLKQAKQQLAKSWMQLRLSLRPRARIKAIFKK